MFIIQAISYIEPRHRDAFISLVAGQIRETRREQGSIHYTCSEDLTEPGAFHWFQAWTDYEAWVRHEKTEHNTAFLAGLEPLRSGRPSQAHLFDAEARPR